MVYGISLLLRSRRTMTYLDEHNIVALKYDRLVNKIKEVQRRIFHKHFSRDPKQLYYELSSRQSEILQLKNQGILDEEKYGVLFSALRSKEIDPGILDTATMNFLLRNFGDTGYNNSGHGNDTGYANDIKNLEVLNQGLYEGSGSVIRRLRTNNDYKSLYEKLKQPFLELGCSKEELNDLLRFPAPIQYRFIPAGNEHIVMRREELQEVHLRMQSRIGKRARDGKFGLLIHAAAGVGKTEFAKMYFQTYTSFFNSNVVWINAASLEKSFKELAEYLTLQMKDKNGNYEDINKIVQAVHGYLADDKVLYVFDNADSIEEKHFLRFLPRAVGNFSLILSQDSLKWSSVHFEMCALPPFNCQEALNFFKQELKMAAVNCELYKSLRDILKLFGYNILALKHFTTNILQTGIRMEKYVDLIKQRPLKPSLRRDENAIASAININIGLLSQLSPEVSELAKHILHTMRFLNKTGIQRGFFLYLKFGDRFNKELNQEKVNKVLYHLEKFSLVSIQSSGHENSDEDLIIIHSLVQNTLRIIQENAGVEVQVYRYLLQHFTHAGNGEFLYIRKIHFRYFKFWYDQFIYLYKSDILRREFFKCFSKNIHFFTDVLLNRREFDIYEEILDALSNNEICSHNPRLFYNVQYFKALCSYSSKRHDPINSLQNYKDVLEKQITAFGPRDHDSLRTWLAYGEALCNTSGSMKDGAQNLLQLYDIQREVLGDFHCQTLVCMRRIFHYIGNKGLLEDSLQCLGIVFLKQSEFYFKPHPELYETQLLMADALYASGEIIKWKKIVYELYHNFEDMYPVFHTATALYHQIYISALLFSEDEIDLAIEILKKSLLSFQRCFYSDDGDKKLVMYVKFVMIRIFRKLGEFHDELSLLIDIVEELENVSSPVTIYVKALVVANLVHQKQIDEAFCYLQKHILAGCITEQEDGFVHVAGHQYMVDLITFVDLLSQNQNNKVTDALKLADTFLGKISKELFATCV